MNELGVVNYFTVTGNDVYKPVEYSPEYIFEQHDNILKSEFAITLSEKNKNIPLLYWNSKQHKSHLKF
jgi:hypothetical protein